MMVVVFLAGMVLDFIPIVLIFTPVFLPIAIQAGVDPIYFGVIFIMNCSVGMITPPVGVVLNVVSSIGKISMPQAVKGVMPFLLAECRRAGGAGPVPGPGHGARRLVALDAFSHPAYQQPQETYP